jgi:hypothetical protein
MTRFGREQNVCFGVSNGDKRTFVPLTRRSETDSTFVDCWFSFTPELWR